MRHARVPSRSRRWGLAVSWTLSMSILVGASADAQSTTWTGAGGTGWGVPGNWDNGVPDAATTAVVPDVSGTTGNFPSTAGGAATCGDLVLNTGATLHVHDFTANLFVHGSLSVAGAVTGTGTIVLQGGSAAGCSAASPLPGLTIDKAGGSATVTGVVGVAQSLVLSAGDLVVDGTLTVGLTASFAGGTLSGNGLLDLHGHATFSGTVSTSPPAIECAGDWVGHEGFAPLSGVVRMDGPDGLMSGTLRFHDLELAVGAPAIEATAATPVEVGGSLTIRGNATFDADASVDVAGNTTVELGGRFDFGASTHYLGGDLTVVGDGLQGSGTFVFDGVSTATLQSSDALANVTCDKIGVAELRTSGTLVIDGDLLLLSGILRVLPAKTEVNGDGTFTGGSLTGTGTLDMDGDVVFAGTSVTAPPTITCQGNWSAQSAFDPDAGSVTFDGPPGTTRTINGEAPIFFDLRVIPSATVTNVVPVRVKNDLTVTAILDAGASLDVDGSILVPSAGAEFDAGPHEHSIGENLTVSGILTGTGILVFDENTAGTIFVTSGTSLPSVEVAKAGGKRLTMMGVFTIAGTLDLVSGELRFQWASPTSPTTIAVTGNAAFSGGTLSYSVFTGQPTLEVDGDVTFSGAVSVLPPHIRCGGSWGADHLFDPNGGTVTFQGAPRQITGTAARFFDVVIDSGAKVTALLDVHVARDLTINGELTTSHALDVDRHVVVGPQGTFDTGPKTHHLGGGFTSTGNLNLSPGTVFRFDGATGGTIAADQALPSVEIVKVGASSMTLAPGNDVQGRLELVAGALVVGSASGGGGLSKVAETATFGGGVVTGTGTLDVEGDIVFAGAQTATNPFGHTDVPSFFCRGSWTAHPNWQPSFGTVTFDPPAAAPSEILGTEAVFHDLVVVNGSTVTAAVDVHVVRDLVVSGRFVTTAGLDVDDDVTVSNELNVGSGTVRFGSDVTITGAIVSSPGALLVLDGASSGLVTSQANPLPPVEIAKQGAGVATFGGPLVVSDAIQLLSGTLDVQGNTTVDASGPGQGNVIFAGGILTGSASATLDVARDVTFSGTYCATPPNVECSGDWSANPLFQPVQGEVVFRQSPGVQTIDGTFANFHDLRVESNVTSLIPLAFTGDLTVKNATFAVESAVSVPVAGTLTSTGSVSAPATTWIVEGPVAIQAGSFTIAGGSFGDDLVAEGILSSGPITFHGAQSATLRSTNVLPSVTVAKSASSSVATVGTLEIIGDVVIESGILHVASEVRVEGDAYFVGGTLTGSSSGSVVLDVDGDVTFAGTVAITPPSMEVEGDFTAHPFFIPVQSRVLIDGNPGTPMHQIAGALARFHDLEVAQFQDVAAVGDIEVSGDLIVGGTLQTAGTVDVEGETSVDGAGTFLAGAGDHSFGGNLEVYGALSASGTFTLDGFTPHPGAVILSAQSPLPDLVVAKAGDVSFQGDAIVASIELQSGNLDVVSGTVSVPGDATFLGGILTGAGSPSVLDVDGDVVFTGTGVTAPPDIRCAGDWTGHVNFNPSTTRTVVFDGAGGTQLIDGENLVFQKLTVAPDAAVRTDTPLTIRSDVVIDGDFETTSTLDVDGSISQNTASVLDLGDGTHQLAGSLFLAGQVLAGGTLVLDNDVAVDLSASDSLPDVRKTGTGETRVGGSCRSSTSRRRARCSSRSG